MHGKPLIGAGRESVPRSLRGKRKMTANLKRNKQLLARKRMIMHSTSVLLAFIMGQNKKSLRKQCQSAPRESVPKKGNGFRMHGIRAS